MGAANKIGVGGSRSKNGLRRKDDASEMVGGVGGALEGRKGRKSGADLIKKLFRSCCATRRGVAIRESKRRSDRNKRRSSCIMWDARSRGRFPIGNIIVRTKPSRGTTLKARMEESSKTPRKSMAGMPRNVQAGRRRQWWSIWAAGRGELQKKANRQPSRSTPWNQHIQSHRTK